jgi:hypothetical protein
MAFNPNAKTDPFISVDVEPRLPLSAPARRAVEIADRQQPGVRNEYAEEAVSMRREETHLLTAIRELRTEAERLIVWMRDMGAGTGASSWGPWQQTYSADLRRTNRAKADKLKSEVEAKFPGDAGRRLLDAIFATPGKYPPNVTQEARTELGL